MSRRSNAAPARRREAQRPVECGLPPDRVPRASERLLTRLAQTEEAGRFMDALCTALQVSPLELLDTCVPLLSKGLVIQAQVPEGSRQFRSRLDVSPKGARYLEHA